MIIIVEISSKEVVFGGDGLSVTESGLSGASFNAPWCTPDKFTAYVVDNIPEDFSGRWYTYSGGAWSLTAFGSDQKAAKEAQDLFDSIVFDTLSSDTWIIPADGITHATVTYTDQETVYFSVNETVHAVEPVDYVATLEITADAPGPIRVEVKSKQLIITAIEDNPQ